MPERAKVTILGAVQGVGFRPFVHRLATELGLCGWAQNSSQGVFIDIEGARDSLDQFLLRLDREKPPGAFIQSMEFSFLEPAGHRGFEIRSSDDAGKKCAWILPDIATCPDCLQEILDPNNRRHRYPFTNCTHCGPRFTIVESLPYDRKNTSMKKFAMCPDCTREYHDPHDRRFHAQPTACPRCGPRLQLRDATGCVLAGQDDALLRAADAVRAGKILALKGIGGFQLIVDARDEAAVARLRERKHREEKPFALMFPSLDAAREECRISELEARLLLSPESPAVLLQRITGFTQLAPHVVPINKMGTLRTASLPGFTRLAPSVAPRNPNLGVMLPYSPLHHLLLRDLGFPIVATSGNLSDEPICIDETEALERLLGIADFFLVHDRPIVRHMDDSVVRVVRGRELVLRRARGYAPLPVHAKEPLPAVLAVGAHLKNAVALSIGTEIFISQHIGDLETEQAWSAFRHVAADLPRLYEAEPEMIACDMHPDYLSTKYAAQLRAPSAPVQHHWAHVAACMAENELAPPALGVAWDGTGYGPDGTIWGGEFLVAGGGGFTRAGHLRQFRLPGGDAAIREPRRCALGLLHAIFGEELWERAGLLLNFSKSEIPPLRQMLAKGINAPPTSSAGRLFDAVSALANLRQRTSFEGQAAMELEFAIQSGVDAAYPFDLREGVPCVIDWQPALLEILRDIERHEVAGIIAAKFHNTLAEMIVAMARKIGEPNVALSGGCFQNKYLAERAADRLAAAGFRPFLHQRVPPNDGGIALGQIVATAWRGSAGAPTSCRPVPKQTDVG